MRTETVFITPDDRIFYNKADALLWERRCAVEENITNHIARDSKIDGSLVDAAWIVTNVEFLLPELKSLAESEGGNA